MGKRQEKRQRELEAKRAVREQKVQKPQFKYLLTVAYDGSRYGGYAKQKHGNTVQNVLEATLKTYLGEEIKTTESSRTDAKVHALCQKVQFEWSAKLSLEKVRTQLNELLPRDIIIIDLETVVPDFHCRHHVLSKTYAYTITSKLDPRTLDYGWLVERDLNIEKMIAASRCLLGTHDFSTFKSAKATTDGSVRTINFLEIAKEGDNLVVRINADGFLYNMVRLIVKALVDVGSGKEKLDYIERLLALQEKPDNLESAPAGGLCLMEIHYP